MRSEEKTSRQQKTKKKKTKKTKDEKRQQEPARHPRTNLFLSLLFRLFAFSPFRLRGCSESETSRHGDLSLYQRFDCGIPGYRACYGACGHLLTGRCFATESIEMAAVPTDSLVSSLLSSKHHIHPSIHHIHPPFRLRFAFPRHLVAFHFISTLHFRALLRPEA